MQTNIGSHLKMMFIFLALQQEPATEFFGKLW